MQLCLRLRQPIQMLPVSGIPETGMLDQVRCIDLHLQFRSLSE